MKPDSLVQCRAATQAMLPRVDLPELPLEVHAWTGFMKRAYTHLGPHDGNGDHNQQIAWHATSWCRRNST
jgi:hypothetical protein